MKQCAKTLILYFEKTVEVFCLVDLVQPYVDWSEQLTTYFKLQKNLTQSVRPLGSSLKTIASDLQSSTMGKYVQVCLRFESQETTRIVVQWSGYFVVAGCARNL